MHAIAVVAMRPAKLLSLAVWSTMGALHRCLCSTPLALSKSADLFQVILICSQETLIQANPSSPNWKCCISDEVLANMSTKITKRTSSGGRILPLGQGSISLKFPKFTQTGMPSVRLSKRGPVFCTFLKLACTYKLLRPRLVIFYPIWCNSLRGLVAPWRKTRCTITVIPS